MIKRKYDFISPEETLVLYNKYKDPFYFLYHLNVDTNSRNKMIESVIPLIINLVRKFSLSNTDLIYDDVLQEMFIIAHRAVDTWKPNLGAWTTHVGSAVKWQLRSYTQQNNRSLIKTGRDIRKKVKEWNPKNKKQEVRFIRAKSCMDYITFSEDRNSYVPKIKIEDMFVKIERDSNKIHCKNLINRLDPRNKIIIEMRFGLNGYAQHTLKEVGTKFGISKERVRQLQKVSIEKLRDE